MNQLETATVKIVIEAIEEGRNLRMVDVTMTEVLGGLIREGKITNLEFGKLLSMAEHMRGLYEAEGLERLKEIVARW